MKELTLIAELIFEEVARESFNFPIKNSIRLSFWILGDSSSTFSELHLQGNSIEIKTISTVKVILAEMDFLVNRLEVGTEFRMGVFPKEIANGKIMEVY